MNLKSTSLYRNKVISIKQIKETYRYKQEEYYSCCIETFFKMGQNFIFLFNMEDKPKKNNFYLIVDYFPRKSFAKSVNPETDDWTIELVIFDGFRLK